MSGALAINTKNYQAEVVQSELPVLMDVYAEWCGPCRMMGPVIDSISTELAGKVKVVKLDSDQAGDIAADFGVSSIPCFLFLKSGAEVDRRVGACSRDEMLNWVKQRAG